MSYSLLRATSKMKKTMSNTEWAVVFVNYLENIYSTDVQILDRKIYYTIVGKINWIHNTQRGY